MKRIIACLPFLLAAVPAFGERAPVQVGDQRNFGRITITLSSPAPAAVRQKGNRVVVTFPAGTDALSPDTVPRNVISFSAGRGGAQFDVVAGARARSKQAGTTLVIDVLDPASRRHGAAAMVSMRPNPAKPPVPVPLQSAAASPAPAAAPPPPPSQPVAAHTGPAPEDATASPPTPPPSLRVFAAPEVGAAAFRRGSVGVVIFDDAVEIADPDDSDDPPLRATAQQIQRGTMLTVPLAGSEALSLRRTAESWIVSTATPTGSPAAATAVPSGIQYQVAKPGRALTVSDPMSGQTMLIGTTRQANGERALVDARRVAPGYELLPTWLGIAVAPSSDAIDLRTSLSGYTLDIADRAAVNRTAASVEDNQLGIPVAPADVLVQQLNAQIASAAAAPPRSRGRDRLQAARTMLALGMASEAEALIGLAANDDPVLARDPTTDALAAAAAVLAGRPLEAAGLDNPALPTDGDIALWRGLRDAAIGKPTPTLASTWPSLATYPDAIRRQIAPPVLEAAASAGVPVPDAAFEGPPLALARALRQQHDGEIEPALAALDALTSSRDERASVRAAAAAAELRLSQGQITASDAADKLERQAVRWRGDRQELEYRLRAAELRATAGEWRGALDGLRQVEQLFPDAKGEVVQHKTAVFRSLLADQPPRVSPLDLVAIASDFAESLPGGADGDRMAGLLADKLAALDLPSRAIPVLQRLIDRTEAPTAKTEYALRLAQMFLDAGDPAKADALLSALDMSGSPAGSSDQRTLLMARVKAAQGDYAGGAVLAATVQSPEAEDMRASLYARAGDWPHSLQTLAQIAGRTVPDAGDLTDAQQDLLLREATAAVQAGDTDALRGLMRFQTRIKPPKADLFRVLTATAIKSPEDLPRAGRELASSRNLPDRLEAMRLR